MSSKKDSGSEDCKGALGKLELQKAGKYFAEFSSHSGLELVCKE